MARKGTHPVEVTHQANVAALRRFDILDTAPESAFDHIVDIASRSFGVPTVLISLLDLNRQWFKAKVGLEVCETDLDVSFCKHAVRQDGVMVILDATKDDRFCGNPLVAPPDGIRFYAGAPLHTSDGFTVGTLCLVDTVARNDFCDADKDLLARMATLVVELMEGRANKKAVEREKSRLEDFASSASDIFWETDENHRFTTFMLNAELVGDSDKQAWAKGVFSSLMGKTRIGALGVNPKEEPWASHLSALNKHQPFNDLRYSIDRLGEPAHLSVSGKPVFSDSGAFLGYRGATYDITAQENARLEALQIAHTDSLTGLANRRHWNQVLEECLSNQQGRDHCVLLMDVDRFKDINDALGHAAGDQLLVALADRMAACAPSAKLIARLGGDEFAILLGENRQRAEDIATSILQAMDAPIVVDGQSLSVHVSIGIKPIHSASRVTHDVMLGADLALRSAKLEGRAQWKVFVPEMRVETDRRLALVAQFDRAIANREFELHYQPQLCLHDHAVVGMEALLRWRHPDQGILPPAHFLEALENSTFYIQVGRIVIDMACAQAARWKDADTPVRVGINVSASQLYGDDLCGTIVDAMARHGTSPECIEIEITERVALGDVDRVASVLEQIRALGVSIAFDDFGTGFASLSSLIRFPVDRVKIDKSFISDIDYNTQNSRLTASLIGMCRGLGLKVIAEGVEDAGHEAFLRMHQADEVQGFLYACPMPEDAATKFMSERIPAQCDSKVASDGHALLQKAG